MTANPAFWLDGLGRDAAPDSGGSRVLQRQRIPDQRDVGPAILTPVEAFGVHPPWTRSAGRQPLLLSSLVSHLSFRITLRYLRQRLRFARQPTCYFPLMPYYTPYYIGYCPHRLRNPKPLPYGFDGGWGPGPMPGPRWQGCCCLSASTMAPTRPILKDDTIFWNMGGNGLVPYGAPRPPHAGRRTSWT